MGLYPQIPHGVIAVTIQRNKAISEAYTAHVAPAHMEKSEKWFLRRDTKNPNQMIYVSTKGEVSWDIPMDSLPTVEERQHWDRHPSKVCLTSTSKRWQNIPGKVDSDLAIDKDQQEISCVPSQFSFEQAEPELPNAPTGSSSKYQRGNPSSPSATS